MVLTRSASAMGRLAVGFATLLLVTGMATAPDGGGVQPTEPLPGSVPGVTVDEPGPAADEVTASPSTPTPTPMPSPTPTPTPVPVPVPEPEQEPEPEPAPAPAPAPAPTPTPTPVPVVSPPAYGKHGLTSHQLSSVSGMALMGHHSWLRPYSVRAVNLASGAAHDGDAILTGTDSYSIRSLPPGEYLIEFRGLYGSIYLGDVSDPEAATAVTIRPGPAQDVAGVDVLLGAPPTIVGVIPGSGGATIRWEYCDTGQVEESDEFPIIVVKGYDFTVDVPMNRPLRILSLGDGPPYEPHGECVTLQTGEAHSIREVRELPTVSGMIRVPAGEARLFIVYVVDPHGRELRVAEGLIPAGESSVPWTASIRADAWELFIQVEGVGRAWPFSDNPQIRPPVPVILRDGDVLTGMDVTFLAGVRIRGVISTESDESVVRGRVYLYHESAPDVPAAVSSVEPGGIFEVWGLAPGSYTARFEASLVNTVLTPQWYVRSPDQAGATRIILPSTSTTVDDLSIVMGTGPIPPVVAPLPPVQPDEAGPPTTPVTPTDPVTPRTNNGPVVHPPLFSGRDYIDAWRKSIESRNTAGRLADTGGAFDPSSMAFIGVLVLVTGILLRGHPRSRNSERFRS